MRTRITLAASIAAVVVAMLIPASPSGADTNEFGTCPDRYQPTVFPSPEDDRNGNGVVCVKFVGSHVNVHDDPNGQRYRCNGFPTPPAECVDDPDGTVFILDETTG